MVGYKEEDYRESSNDAVPLDDDHDDDEAWVAAARKRKAVYYCDEEEPGDDGHCCRRRRKTHGSGSNLLEEVQAMVYTNLWDDDVDVVRRALEDLAFLCFCSSAAPPMPQEQQERRDDGAVDNRGLIIRSAGHLAIVKTMERLSEWESIQTAGCRALINLSLPRRVIAAKSDSSPVDKYSDEIVEWNDAERCFLENGASVLSSDDNGGTTQTPLEYSYYADYASYIALCGGIRVILSAMSDHVASIALQSVACDALYNLSFGGSEIKACIVDCGGLDAISAAIRAHPASETLQRASRAAIRCLL